MKTLLIVLFILLFIYLIIHICSGSGDRSVSRRSEKGLAKSMLVLDGLQSLEDEELTRLKEDLEDLKAVLDKKPAGDGVATDGGGLSRHRGRQRKSGRVILSGIRKNVSRMEGYHHRGNSFSKFRVILVQIALILITILMIVL